MRGSVSAAVVGSTRLLIVMAWLALVATSCAIAPQPAREAVVVVVPTPIPDALDPCAGAPSTSNSGTGTPESVALRDLHAWSQFPVRDTRARTVINDGSFARVVVCAQVRHGPNDAWDEFSGEYTLSLLRGQWTVQDSPLNRFTGFVSVKGEATRQAAERATNDKMRAALTAREAIRASVVGITEVRDVPADYSYSKVTLELESTDGKQHTVLFWPNFRATMRQCALTSLEGAESIMSISGLFSSQPKEKIGPEPIQRDYAFKAAQNPWHGVFARPNCQILSDARDVQLTIEQIDGVEAYQMERAERRLAAATATPTPVPTVSAVATELLPSPTPIATVAPTSSTASGGVSLPDVSAVLLGAGAVLFGMVVVCRAVFGGQIAMIRSGVPRERRAETSRKENGTTSQRNEPEPANPGDSGVELIADSGPLTAASVSVTEAAAPLTVKCFGGLQVACADRVLWPSRELSQEQRAWELLFFLAASPPDGVDREAVGAALWPDVDLADVVASLRQLRRRLRLMLVRAVPGLPEGAPLESDTGRIYRLDPRLVASDLHRFLELLKIARSEGTSALGTLERAYALYEGDLFDSPTAPPFAWAVDPGEDGTSLRQQYRKQFLELCRVLADLHVAGGGGAYVERAIDLYRRVLQVDPLDERVWRALLSAHAKRHDRTALDREWGRFIEVLRAADSAAAPETETSELYRRLTAASQALARGISG